MKRILKYCPLYSVILVTIAIFCLFINALAILSEGFANFMNYVVGAFFRLILAKLSGWWPISFAEILIVSSPLIITAIVVLSIRGFKNGKVSGIRFLCGTFSVLTLFYSSFVLTFACGYRGRTLDKALGLQRAEVTNEDLISTAEQIIEELNALSAVTEYGQDRFSVMPYSYEELNEKLNAAYIVGAERYPFIQKMKSNVKPVMLSEPMTYTHISGVYTFFTGEANVNINYPSYNLPFTMAHEMAHQRGIARENEANFVAFLICLESTDAYIRYSAYFNMLEYLSNAVYKTDIEAYRQLMKTVDINVRYEMIAYSEFFDKYRDSIASDVSGAVNNSYLISQGQTSGTRSYGLVVDLCVAYYKSNKA